MTDMLLGVSPEYLFHQKGKITHVDTLHQPYFLGFKNTKAETDAAKKHLKEIWEKNNDTFPWSYITKIGDIEEYNSFWHPTKKRHVFPLFVNQSFRVPEVSDYLFFNHNLFSAEHDIPYQQRVLVDIAAKKDEWMYDTQGKEQSISMLVYDIEMSEFIPGKTDSPIDIIGFAANNLSFHSSKNLETENFDFDFHQVPDIVEEDDIIQLISRNEDEELDHLIQFCRTIPKFDIISGHNIIGFDNRQVHGRVKKLLQQYQSSLSEKQQQPLKDFLYKYSRVDKSFHFGVGSDVIQIYPSGFDTYLAARKFYPNLDSHSLKAVAPFLGYGVDNRLILSPEEISIDDTTLKYNRQDVIEQMGVSLQLIQLALPLSFTTGMPFEMLLSAGAVNMWDHMALVRGAFTKKLMPATCRVNNIAKTLTRNFHHIRSREDILKQTNENRDQLSKEFVRVVKYGPEMPDWMLYPYVIHNESASDDDERSGYHMPGGMTIKPDRDADSHFIPWYKVVVADVGAMYPTILKALNIGADTVQLCKKSEKPDMWVWFKRLPKQFFDEIDVAWKPVEDNKDSFADKGYWVGIRILKETGVVNGAMTGIMGMIAKIKQELHEVQKEGDSEEIKRLKMMYQSVKGARNAGSVDYNQRIILINPSGNYNPKRIGEFVDETIASNGSTTELINGTKFEITKVTEPWYAVSVTVDGKTEIKKVTKAVRHKYEGKLVKITTKSGSTVVTPNHSVFTVKNNKLAMIDAGKLNDDISIVHANKIPNIESNQDINLINEIKSPGYFAYIQKEDIIHFNEFKEKLIQANVKSNSSTSYLKIPLSEIKEIQLPKPSLRYVKIGSNGRQTSIIPSIIPIDEDFSELLGYYISEGHISKRVKNGNPFYYITFSSASKKMHDRIQLLSNNVFGLNVYTLDRLKYAGSYVSTIHAKILKHLFVDILKCGKNSKSKQIPPFILSSNESVKRSFIDAYMAGDGNIKKDMPSSVPLGRFTTNSRCLNEDLILLKRQEGVKTNTYTRSSDKTYNTRMINFFKGRKECFSDCFAIPPKKIEFVESSSNYVYDISVKDNENFVDVNGGIVLHNTHGILAAPNVSGRQFNLWGACAITTKGQVILDDTLQMLKKKGIRVTYGDTDGIYMGCSRSLSKLPSFAKALGSESKEEENIDWLTPPDKAIEAIKECNVKWQNQLDYTEFELEPEYHDAMIFVKHKNYLIFDEKNGIVEMATKGNNFKGSDKANIARKALKEIMVNVLRDVSTWSDEDEARSLVKDSIRKHTQNVIASLDFSKVDIEDLTLIQSVKPARSYKTNQDGSMSTFGKRAKALESLLDEPIRSRIKLRFVVTKKPLPGIQHPSKSGVKPIDFMYPIDMLNDKKDIDLEWYKDMIENYIQGAFGLAKLGETQQTGLDAWM